MPLTFRCGCGRTDTITREELRSCRFDDIAPPTASDEEYIAACDALWTKGRHGLMCSHCTG